MTHKFHCWVFALEKEELKFIQIPIHEYIDITALFIVMVKIWKQLKYTSMSKWINKSWYITWIEYYSVIKKNIHREAGLTKKCWGESSQSNEIKWEQRDKEF